MPDSRELQLLLTLKDKASKQLAGVSKKFEQNAKKIGKAMTVAGVAITALGVTSIKAFQAQERAETRLTQIAKEVTGATDEQIKSMKDLSAEYQKLGVVGDEVLISGQSQLASFSLTSDEIGVLTGSMADLLVANKGVNATQEDAITSANALGKAVATGLLGPLQLSGVLLTDQQKALFEVADQTERVAILNDVLQQNYGGLNEAMRQTSEGGVQALKNSFGDLQEQIGAQLVPMLQKIVDKLKPIIDNVMAWIKENPELTQKIVMVVAALGAFLLIMGPILMAITGLIAVFVFLFSPIGLIIIAIGLLIAVGVFFALKWTEIKEDLLVIWNELAKVGGQIATKLKEAWASFTGAIKSAIVGAFESVKSVIKSGINWIINKLNKFVRAANAITSKMNIVPGVNIPNIPEIPHLAKGGIVTQPTTALIGEAGSEAIIPLDKAGGFGTTISITVNGDVTGMELVGKVKQAIMMELGQNTRFATG
ncbi:phage tail tape measure protein [Candidatus Fermentibacteria bacterium]|nr:MAG: phage tail tape measure protein [Candidatus Fermentibacteria bacterium]